MTWVYSITSGQLSHDGTPIGIGYSGFGEGKNNPKMVSIEDIGPIPMGLWDIGPSYDDPSKGPCVMRLIPQKGTETYGRDGFLIHGDSRTHPGQASHGCVILGPFIRQQIANSKDKILQVIA